MSEKYLPSLPSTEIAADHLNKFSMFEEYCKSAPLQKLKNEAPEVINDDKFTDWVLEGRVKSAAYDVRKDLPSILKDKGSRKVFFNTESTDAIAESRKVLYVDRPEENNGTLKKIKDMTDFLEEIEIGEFKNSLADNERAIKTIKKFKSTVNDFCNKLDINKQNGGFLKRLSGNRKLKFV